MSVASVLRDHYQREKARLEGKALSRARFIKAAKDIDGLRDQLTVGRAQPIQGSGVRMMDGKPMIFHTDGSLRHVMGKAVTKSQRKALKKARRDAAKS